MISLRSNGVAELVPHNGIVEEVPAETRGRDKEQGSLYCAGTVSILVVDDDDAVCRSAGIACAQTPVVVSHSQMSVLYVLLP